MAKFKWPDATKYGFKYVHGVIDDIESGKKISVEVSKGLLKEELFVSTDKNQKLKENSRMISIHLRILKFG